MGIPKRDATVLWQRIVHSLYNSSRKRKAVSMPK